ncbi:MAG: prolyl oligopeptidase family serine peptidase [Anaerolineae bacterium]|nr:prolyl oligopeptidase family serine peptidase [Anaerolineae bacterium]
MAKRQTSSRSRLKRLTIGAILLAVLVIYGFVSRLGYDAMSLPLERIPPNTPPVAYQDVSFPSRNQTYPVYAFYIPAERANAPVLISIHGYRNSRHDDYHLNRAVYLHNLGYHVLSIDLSDSGGDTIGNGRISMGYAERWDVLGAFDYLLAQGFTPERIGLVGESMGASTALLAAAIDPHIRAVWADSGYTRADVVAGEQVEGLGLPRIIIPGGMLWGVLLSGERLWEAAPIDAGPALAAHQQAIYLVHCDQDKKVVFHHGVDLHTAYQAAGVDVTLWAVPGCEHSNAIVNNRDAYLQRLDAFFRRYLTVS